MSQKAALFLCTAALAGCSLNPFGNGEEEVDTSVNVSETPGGERRSLAGPSREQPRPVARNGGDQTQSSQPVPLAPDAPNRYVVQRGDTLWDISATFLRDPWFWPEIWQVNPQIDDPHLIYPGDVLSLIYVDGQPRLLLERGISSVRLSPQIREQRLDEAINTIAYEQISAFLTRGLVLEREEINSLPYMLASRGDHLVSAAGNDIYVREAGGSRAAELRGFGSRYSVVKIGDALVDPDDGDVVGYEATYVGQGQIRRGGDPSTLRLNDSTREATAGDRLIDQDIDIPLNFFPKPPESEIEGRIISVVDGVSLIGQFQVLVINRGLRDGVSPGVVLSVFEAGEYVRDRFKDGTAFSASTMFGGERVKLPDERAGTIMVFKSYDRISYALVMEAESEIAVLDAVRNPR
ncbi:MAG: LysM peptidoglycan-binding domain-containing protein [Pseudomonadota bacterium]